MKSKMKIGKNKIVILSIVFIIFVSGFGIYIKVLSPGPELNTETKSAVEDLLSLPYLAFVEDDPNPEKKGVTFYNENLSYPGQNIYISRGLNGARLLDMNGSTLHAWYPSTGFNKSFWWLPSIDKEGNIMVVVSKIGLVKMDRASNIQWISKGADDPYLKENGRYHHDFEVSDNGDIYVLGEQIRYIDHKSQTIPIRDHYIVTLSSTGDPKDVISFYDILGDQIPYDWLDKIASKVNPYDWLDKIASKVNQGIRIRRRDIDVFHSNALEEIPHDIGIAKKGDILFCVRNLDLIGILDHETKKIKWSWGPGILDRPHHPTVLENGNILVFDNGYHRNYSRILEINPATKEIVWKYEADLKEEFYTKERGSNQRLPNGNTLITESDKGHVFEVTKDGEIVWEFWNPVSNEDGKRGTIERMMRLEPDFLT
jgi:hypothetical protein